MTDRHVALLIDARRVLERYMFDGDTCQDDVAELCQKIDEILPAPVTLTTSVASPERAAA